jgi:hypothetical protein
MCKWQMDDPEARVKSSLSDCTWLEDLSMDLSSRHLRTYEAKRTEEHLYFVTFNSFPSHFLPFFLFFLYSPFFLTFLFLLIIIFSFSFFFFCSSELLQHNTYIAFVIDDVMTPPMLERCSSSSAKPQIFIEKPNPCTIAIVPGSVAIAYRTSPDYTKSYIASHISNST